MGLLQIDEKSDPRHLSRLPTDVLDVLRHETGQAEEIDRVYREHADLADADFVASICHAGWIDRRALILEH
jgi:hypothetical protein